jgi:hypothetical protein
MARTDFIVQLKNLGYVTQEESNGMVVFTYTILVGKNIGTTLRMALLVKDDYPMNCPPGPHFESLDIDGWIEPKSNIHNSPLKGNWRYWSRPFPDWNRTEKTVKVYLAHIRNLLISL